MRIILDEYENTIKASNEYGQRIKKFEFKESLSEPEAGLRSISSMLNRGKEVTFYFDVKDNGDVIRNDFQWLY